MEEIIRVRDQYYILASSPRFTDRVRVLKRGDSFAIFDGYGDMFAAGLGDQGLFHEGTRYLSRLEFRLAGKRPFVLGSSVRDQASVLAVHLTNLDVYSDDRIILPRDTIHVARSILLRDAVCYERLRLRNFSLDPVTITFSFAFDADFADIFEVRGVRRERRGTTLPAEIHRDGVTLGYEGLDGVIRRTRIQFAPPPSHVDALGARFEESIPPREERTCSVTFSCEAADRGPERVPFSHALERSVSEERDRRATEPRLWSRSRHVNSWIHRSVSDLHMMLTPTSCGDYPYAGIPWFSTVFGRDGIITAFQFLWFRPEVARGVLSFLAATQADAPNPDREAEPGKILHEMRKGEMPALGEVPFGRYYGSVDATPLFVLLAGAYADRTGDLGFIRGLWPNLERALAWIDRFGDRDGDGFVEYARRASGGLSNQGWKDSHDSIFHEDGALAEGPIALCEVQAYVYRARMEAARLALRLGIPDRAAELRRQAAELQTRFEEAFWCEDLSTYALALDGHKRPCKVRASNAGHALFGGIASPERAQRVADTLMDSAGFSGWGIRTVAATEVRYNPMSYHNGSVWPHDNSLIAFGLSQYLVSKTAISKIFSGLLEACGSSDLHRLPELFCGFHRLPDEGPIRYPMACSPQAWSAGALFLLLQAALGLSIDSERGQIRFVRPALPEGLEELCIRDLRVGTASVNLDLHRLPHDVGIEVVGRSGDVEVSVVK